MKSTLNVKSPVLLQNSMTGIIQSQNKIMGNEKIFPDQEDNMTLATANKGIYNRLPLIISYLLDIDLPL